MSQNAQEAIASYLTDMLALEEHLQKAFAGQRADVTEERYSAILRELNTKSELHLGALRDLATRREQAGQGIAEVVKSAASSVLGWGAAAVDLVRSEKLPKNLRDDYAAVSLATVGYLMLLTTARALHDAEVAALALEHLGDYTRATMKLFHIIPESVVGYLAGEGFPIDHSLTATLGEALDDVWEPSAASHAS